MGTNDTTSTRHHEIERKFAVPAGVAVPGFTTIADVDRVGEPRESTLEALYYDTAERALTASDVSLRRRTGGSDAGWHLKRPSSRTSHEDRRELHVPLEGDGTDIDPLGDEAAAVPPVLVRGTAALTRGRALEPVVVLRTRRTERELCAADGTCLALLADDVVTVRRPGSDDDAAPGWHELEVELVDGDRAILDDVERCVAEAGIVTAAWPSKVRHALEVLGDEATTSLGEASAGADHGRKATTADVVLRHLRRYRDVIVDLDPDVRDADMDAVHDVRVACRRLRSALATFRGVLDRTATDPVRDELKWFGQVLGGVRDADVLRERLLAAAADLPAILTLGPVADRTDVELRRRHDEAFAELERVLAEPRYLALLDALDALLESPPLLADAHRRARAVLPATIDKEIRRVRRAGRGVDRAPDDAARLVALHELRKASKRGRYAAESVEVVFGTPARRVARRMEALQEALGEHQDSVAARDELRRLGALTHDHADENGFSFGVLHQREAEASDAALDDLDRLRRRASGPFRT